MFARLPWMSGQSSGEPSSSTPRIDNDDLTYGVELEFVFAFHESKLELGRTDGRQDKIIKNLPYLVRETNCFTTIPPEVFPNHAYNSWGILRGGRKPAMPYKREPQEIVGRILDQKCPQIGYNICDTMKMRDQTTDKYFEWLICKDHTVCGVGSDKIFPGWLRGSINDELEGNWDSIGLEAVSRILATGTPEDMQEIADIVRALKGGPVDRYGSFITNQCGLHVHVLAPYRLAATRELATLLLIYEEEISRLHPPCRRPHYKESEDGPRATIDSNRIKILWGERDDLLPRRQRQVLDRSTKVLKKAYSITHLRQKMESSFDSIESLAGFMNYPPGVDSQRNGNRNRIVNFTTAARGPEFSKTIEFRQARGSLDPEEISHWVNFCTGLIRLAKFYSENPDRFPVKNWDDICQNGHYQRNKVDVFDLMRDMELSDEEIQYWERQVARYQTGTTGDKDDRTDNEMPPVDPPARDLDKESGKDDNNFPSDDDDEDDDNEGGRPPGSRQGSKWPSSLYEIGEDDAEEGFTTSPNVPESRNVEATEIQHPEYISISSSRESSEEEESDGESSDDQELIAEQLASELYTSLSQDEHEDSSLVDDDDDDNEADNDNSTAEKLAAGDTNPEDSQSHTGDTEVEELTEARVAAERKLIKRAERASRHGDKQEALRLFSKCYQEATDLECWTHATYALSDYIFFGGMLKPSRMLVYLEYAITSINQLIEQEPDDKLWALMRESCLLRQKALTRMSDELVGGIVHDEEPVDFKAGEASELVIPGVQSERQNNVDEDPDDYICGLKLHDYRHEHWETIPTLGTIGKHLNASAAHAIYDSIRYQYSNEVFLTQPKAIVLHEILSVLDSFSGVVKRSHNIIEVRDTLSSLFGQEFALVILRNPLGRGGPGRMAELIGRPDRKFLYLGFTRIHGLTRWQTMRRTLIEEPEEQESQQDVQEDALSDLLDYEDMIAWEAEQGAATEEVLAILSHYEDMVENVDEPEPEPDPHPGEYQPRFLPNFNSDDWEYEEGEKHIIGQRQYVSAAYALYDSLEAQYPDSEYVTTCDASDVLFHLDNVILNGSHHTKWNGARGLKDWTNDEFKLVVVEPDIDPITGVYKAERISPGNGGNELFVKYEEHSSAGGTETLWQYMRRRNNKKKKSGDRNLKTLPAAVGKKSSNRKEQKIAEDEVNGGGRTSKTPSPNKKRKYDRGNKKETDRNEEEEAEEDPTPNSPPIKKRKSSKGAEKETAANEGKAKSAKSKKHTMILFPRDHIQRVVAGLPVPPGASRASQLTGVRPPATPVRQSIRGSPTVAQGPERKRKVDTIAMESPKAKKFRKSTDKGMGDNEEEKEAVHLSPGTKRQVQRAIENNIEIFRNYNTSIARPPVSTAQVGALVGDRPSLVRGSDVFTSGPRIAIENMHNDGFTWRVTNFTIEDWYIEETSSQIERRRNLCGVQALLQSMRAQYPSSVFASASIHEVFNVFRTLARGEGQNADHLQNTLDRWTGNQFRLVVVEDEDRGLVREYAARRVGEHQDSFGANLYVYYTAPDASHRDIEQYQLLGHWESMRRKLGVGQRQ